MFSIYTNIHELNLDWVLATVKQLAEEWMGIEERIENLKNELYSYVDKQDQQYYILMKNYVDSEIKKLLIDFMEKYTAMYGYIDSKMEQAKTDYLAIADSIVKKLGEYPLVIISPFTGREDTIQNVCNMLYDNLCKRNLTAGEYDSLKLTAKEYDDKKLTAMQYDLWGKLYLYDHFFMIRSPETGLWITYAQAIYRLYDFHRAADALTAGEYDGLKITAMGYDDYELTAYNYDWHGKSLLGLIK